MSPSSAPSKAQPPRQAAAWRLGAVAVLLAGYALLSHWLMVHQAAGTLTVGLLFGPLLLAVAAAGWQRRQWPVLAGCVLLLGVLAAVVWRGVVLDAQRLYVLQHGAIHLVLAWGFGLTLREGGTPLISLFAQQVHARMGFPFTAAEAAYTRRLTQVWVGWFIGMVVLSALIYGVAPWTVWSFYCTVVTPLATVALFLGEHVWRRWRHPEFPRVTPRAAFEAWQRHGRAGAG
jgi:uncharacterized membrane protein